MALFCCFVGGSVLSWTDCYGFPGILYAGHSSNYGVSPVYGWAPVAGVYWVYTGHTGIFIFFYVPLMMGTVIGQIDLFWKAAILLSYSLMACLCGVLAFRLRKVSRKAENPTE